MKDLILNIEMKRIPQIQIAYVLPTEEPPQNNKIIVCVCARHRAKHLAHTSVNSHCFIPILQRDKLRPQRSGNLHKVNS